MQIQCDISALNAECFFLILYLPVTQQIALPVDMLRLDAGLAGCLHCLRQAAGAPAADSNALPLMGSQLDGPSPMGDTCSTGSVVFPSSIMLRQCADSQQGCPCTTGGCTSLPLRQAKGLP
jgi:hypothetical protein